MAVGHLGTPLAKKLGIKGGALVATVDVPDELLGFFEDLPDGVEFREGTDGDAAIVLLFATERADLERHLPGAAAAIYPNGAIWVAWPKKASKVPTDMTEDVVRDLALPMNLVDNKVCAISDIWSGLHVVWRKEHRRRGSDVS
jgi:hypothetical protein